MIDSFMDGAEVKRVREKLGLTQEQFALRVGFQGPLRRQSISKIEVGTNAVDYLRANLIHAMDLGYEPILFERLIPQGAELSLRQAEALWAAREEGSVHTLKTSSRNGPFIAMVSELHRRGLLRAGKITAAGREALTAFEKGTKLNPRTKGNPKGRWA